MKVNNNIYFDIGNSCTKIGYYQNNKFIIKSWLNQKLTLSNLKQIINKSDHDVYISSVNLKQEKRIINYLTKLNVKFINFKHQHLASLKPLFNEVIEFDQIGIDLIFASFFLENEKNALILILGTVFVFIIKKQRVEGFLFLPNLLNTYQNLIKQINLKANLSYINQNHLFLYGTNNDECFSLSIAYLFSSFINNCLMQNKLSNLFVTGGNQSFFHTYYLNQQKYKVNYVDNSCLLGLKKFVEAK